MIMRFRQPQTGCLIFPLLFTALSRKSQRVLPASERSLPMFTVKTPEEALAVIREHFSRRSETESVPLTECTGRVLCRDITAEEYVPGFDRSTVDGYALRAADTFGCSEAIPAILPAAFSVEMGHAPERELPPGCCAGVPTGGALPAGADAVVMVEYTEDYGDGSIGITKPASPGLNVIYRGDDVSPGKTVLPAGRRLNASDIGALAAMGVLSVPVSRRPLIGILSTGDELVSPGQVPGDGQVRDVNSVMLEVLCRSLGADARSYGFIRDDSGLLAAGLKRALSECDAVLISGGSSVGVRDATAEVILQHGKILFHGIAMKPGKPTILGEACGKPVFGLPGHPGAAFFITRFFIREMIACMTGETLRDSAVAACLSEAVSANHGRSELLSVQLFRQDGRRMARPVHSKSGLISSLAGSDGFIMIPRDCEGLAAGSSVDVYLY